MAEPTGELSPLEEGHHVHYFVERSEVGGRGKTGGWMPSSRCASTAEKVSGLDAEGGVGWPVLSP